MRRFRWWAVLLLVPALAVPLTLGGCGSDNKPRKSKPKRTDDDERDDDKGGAAEGTPPGGGGEAVEERTELPSTGWGTLRGTVFVEGDPPVPKVIQQAKEHKDHLVCGHDDPHNRSWGDPPIHPPAMSKAFAAICETRSAAFGEFRKFLTIALSRRTAR